MMDKQFRVILQRLSRPVSLARLFFVLLAMWMAAYLAWDTKQDPRLFSLMGFLGSVLIVLISTPNADAQTSHESATAASGWFMV